DGLVARGGMVWSAGWLALALGCATPGAESERSASAATSASQPEQVVHSVMPGAVRSAPAAQGSDGARAPGSTAGALREPRRAARAISSKNLEAELNRLEAELGR